MKHRAQGAVLPITDLHPVACVYPRRPPDMGECEAGRWEILTPAVDGRDIDFVVHQRLNCDVLNVTGLVGLFTLEIYGIMNCWPHSYKGVTTRLPDQSSAYLIQQM